jgi:2-succinyl-5-enolpyruvyl-6-hydroxy-3-cyclohexene-1-carboxylate synthase
MKPNQERAELTLQALAAIGVRALVVAPGGRNSPLVAALQAASGFEVHWFFEERSAAFFALGRARALRETPGRHTAAVVTTSGTAAAECLPAAIEACHSGVPLILVTADRPDHLRGTGAPQTIEQPHMFEPYAPTVPFPDGPPNPELLTLIRPLHLNVPFDEPLLRGPAPGRRYRVASRQRSTAHDESREQLAAFLDLATGPLVLVGALDPDDVPAVRAFLINLGAAVHAEAPSQLREDPALTPFLVRGGDPMLRSFMPCDVLRIGGMPTVRFWRDLEEARVGVLSLSTVPFPGLSRGHLLQGSIRAILEGFEPGPRAEIEPTAVAGEPTWAREDAARMRAVAELLATEPASEPALIHRLSTRLPRDAHVYLGNSSPIREWDPFADTAPNQRRIRASRGANGIDGQLSTFLGLTRPGVENWALVGDLTALYDLSAPWALDQLQDRRVRLVVINNQGGRLFERLFQDPVFVNQHNLNFQDWARMWHVAYHRWDAIPDELPRENHAVIELRPDSDATRRFWSAYDALHAGSDS